MPRPDLAAPVIISAELGSRWQQGSYEVWVLRGNCRIRQGTDTAASHEAVVWIDRTGTGDNGRGKVIAYLEGDVSIDFNHATARTRLTDKTWLGRFHTDTSIEVRPSQVSPVPEPKPGVYQRGLARRHAIPDSRVRPVQFNLPEAIPAPPPEGAPPPGTRRIRVFSRSSVPVEAQWYPDRATNQWIAVITSGVNIIVDGLTGFGSIDVSTDRLVIWTRGLDEPDLKGRQGQPDNVPLEIYMEGNIVFRQGQRVIYADRMYYDVANKVGMVLEAELLTPVPNYEGMLRLKAAILQQLGEDRFLARDAYITSSRMGKPGYRIQTDVATFEDHQRPVFDPRTGTPVLDPETGAPLVDHERRATGQGNTIYLGSVPVFRWPRLATDLTGSSFYIRRAQVKSDSVFGFQALTDWDMYQLLGIEKPLEGTDWTTSLDYLSDRGFGHGTTMAYERNDFFGIVGPTSGLADYWGIQDDGFDNLGADRRGLEPEKHYRWRLLWQHRQLLANEYELTAEVGWISDRNFLEQYYEREWDELKDQNTDVQLKRTRGNRSFSILAQARMNNFFTQTEWLPRIDHFWLGQPALGDVLTWYEHSQLAYARFRTARSPRDPVDAAKFSYLPWETGPGGAPLSGIAGERVVTRQEIDWPLQAGVFKLVPYALGELAHWGEDRTGEPLQRAYGQFGVRASVPMWRVDPTVQSRMWNLSGLAHKVVFDADLSFADANRDLDQLPLYDPLDDDDIEAFRRRFRVVPVPMQLDERYYAVRSGMAGWVTSPTTEIAEDLTTMRLGMRQRWQTKRGAPGRQRIIDWITLDTHAVWYPNEDRDNFGTAVGLVDYDFRWHVGDRLTMLSSGGFDFFNLGQQVVTVGGFLDRPPRGSLYLGLRLLEGPVDNQVLSLSYTYRMGPKWVSAFGTSVDLGGQGNIGQNFSLVRIGESFLISAGATVDASRNNVGVNFAIEPRFLPSTRLGRVGGARIPVAGAYGLE